MSTTSKEPTFTPGEPVTMKDDRNKWPWVVVETLPGGTVRIQRAGRPASMYTQMSTNASALTRGHDR